MKALRDWLVHHLPVRLYWRNWPLATQLAILLVGVALVPLMLFTLYNEVVHREELHLTERARRLLQARNAAVELDEFMEDTLADLRVLVLMPAVGELLRAPKDPTTHNTLRRVFLEMSDVHAYDALFLTDQTGVVLFTTAPSLLGRSYLTHPAFQAAMAGNISFDEPRFDQHAGDTFIYFSAPVRDGAGVILGVLMGRMTMRQFDALARSRIELGNEGSFGMLWNDAGILYSHTLYPEWRFRPFAPLGADVAEKWIAEARFGPATRQTLSQPLNVPQIVTRSRELLYDPTTDAHVQVQFAGLDLVHGSLVPLQNKRWLYGVFTPESEIFGELIVQMNRALQIAILMGLLALVAALIGTRWWLRPLRQMADVAHALADGDMTRRVRLTTHNEVGHLATTFDAMADALAEKDQQLRTYAAGLEAQVAARTAELSASEERYRSLVQVSPDAILLMEWDGTLIFCNEQLAQLHGYASATELIGTNLLKLVAPSEHQRILSSLKDLREGRVDSHEYQLLRQDGTGFIGEVRWSLVRGADNHRAMIIGVTRDVTARKQAEAQLQLQVTALQAAANGIVITDINGMIEWCNDAFTALTGYTLSEAYGKNPRELVRSGKQSRAFYADLWQTVLDGKVWHGRLINRRKDGREYTEEMTITPVRAHGAEITHFVAIKQDVTEQQRAEEQIRQHVAYQTALNAIVTTAVAAGADLQGVLNVALDEILRALGAPIGGVWLLPTSDHPRAFALRGVSVEFEQLTKHIATIRDLAYTELSVVNDWQRVSSPVAEKMLAFGCSASILVPLMVHGQSVGGLNVATPQPREWTAEEIAFMQAVGHQLGLVIERVRLFGDVQTRAEQFSLLYQAGLTLNRSLESRTQLESLCQTAVQAVHADQATVFLYDPEHDLLRFEFATASDLELGAIKGKTFQLGEARGIVGQVAQTRQTLIVSDVRNDPRWIARDERIRSGMWIPLVHEERLLGVLVVVSQQVGAFTSQDEQLLALFANQIAIAMENARLYQSAVRAAERRAILHRASQEVIAAGTNVENVCLAVHRATAELMPCEAFVIALYDPVRDENEAVYLVDRGGRVPGFKLPAHQGLTHRVVASGQTILIDDFEAQPAADAVHFGDPLPVRSILAVPLRAGERVIGMLSAQAYQPRAYNEEDRVLLEMLAAHAGAVLENARLFNETRRRLNALEALSRVSGALRTVQSLDEMMGLLLEETLTVLHAHAASIWLYDPVRQHLYQAAARGFPEVAVPLKPGEGIAGQVFLSGQVYFSSDFKHDPHTHEAYRAVVPEGLGGVAVPIRTAQESLGVLFVSVRESQQLSDDQVYLLTTLAEMAGNAMHRQRLHNQTQQRLEQVQALRTVDMTITSSMDLDVTLNILLERAMAQLNIEGADVLIFNSYLRVLESANQRGLKARADDRRQIQLGEGWAGLAALERRIVAIPDVSAWLATSQLSAESAFARAVVAELRSTVKAYFAAPLIAKGQLKGVLELLHSTPHDLDSDQYSFFEALANQAAIAIDNVQLFRELERSNIELALAYDTTIEGWARTLDLRDEETQGHTERVADLTVRLAAAMGVPDAELVDVRRGALLHDIGKMGIPDHILHKPGALTEVEWEQMRQHPVYAYQVLSPIKFLARALDIPYCHHECWDGTGYPRGLKGEEIPLTARIFAVVDVWDALTSERPYRAAWSPAQARAYIQSMSGQQFDPQVVAAFLRLIPE